MPDPAWERRHPGVEETFTFHFCTADGGLGGFAALTLWPDRAWWWAGLVGTGRPYILVRELDVRPPRSAASLEIRAEALWADLVCEEPFAHWSIGMEAFGVALDDPNDALGDERGDRIGLGFDLGWEVPSDWAGVAVQAQSGDATGSYEQVGAVAGEVLVGGGGHVTAIAVDGTGQRRHTWGRPCWASDAGAGRSAPLEVIQRAPLRIPGAAVQQALCRAPDGCRWTVEVSPEGATGTA